MDSGCNSTASGGSLSSDAASESTSGIIVSLCMVSRSSYVSRASTSQASHIQQKLGNLGL